MGRHQDPKTLGFIETYKRKGATLGFKVSDEFEVLNGLYWIDLTWTPYEKGHNTFITFEIETEENERIYKNFDKIFSLPSLEVEKPYQHFLVIYKGKLSKGNKHLLEEKARTYNIHIFENLENDAKELQAFDAVLDNLQIGIRDYVARIAKSNPAEALRETIMGLGKSLPTLIVDKHPYPINRASLTSGSQIFVGKQINFPENQLFDSKKYKFALMAIPREKYILTIPGSAIAVDVYKDQKSEEKNISFTLEICDYPIAVSCQLIKDDGGSINIEIDPTKADVLDLKKFEEIVEAMNTKKTFNIFDEKYKKIVSAEGIRLMNYNSSERWRQDVSDLAYIQRMTSVRIPAPIDMTINEKDFYDIFKAKQILENGEFLGQLNNVSINATKPTIESFIYNQKSSGFIPDLSLTNDEESLTILNTSVSLGSVITEFPSLIFKEPIDLIEQNIHELTNDTPITVILVPLSSKQFRSIYPKWRKEKN